MKGAGAHIRQHRADLRTSDKLQSPTKEDGRECICKRYLMTTYYHVEEENVIYCTTLIMTHLWKFVLNLFGVYKEFN